MKKLSVLLFLVSLSTSLQAEISYNPNNPEHKLDNYCVGVVSFARDLVFNDVEIIDGKIWMYTVEPTADVKKVRLALTDLSNKLILKYAYSRDFNSQYRAQASNVRKKAMIEGAMYLRKELEKCKKRI